MWWRVEVEGWVVVCVVEGGVGVEVGGQHRPHGGRLSRFYESRRTAHLYRFSRSSRPAQTREVYSMSRLFGRCQSRHVDCRLS